MMLPEPSSQDEAFQAGLSGAPFCAVSKFQVVMQVPEVDRFVDPPGRPTIFLNVDLIGPNQMKWLQTTHWAYSKGTSLKECYKIGRVYRYILWFFDTIELDEKRANTLGAALMEAALEQISRHQKKLVGEGYDSKKFVAHFRRMLDNKFVELPSRKSPADIENEILAYANREMVVTSLGPNGMSAN